MMLVAATFALSLVGVVEEAVPEVCEHFGLAEALAKQTKKPCGELTSTELDAVTDLTIMLWRAKTPLSSRHLEHLPYLETLEIFGPGEKLGPRAFAMLGHLSQLKLRDLGDSFSWDSVRGVKYLDIFLLHGLKSLPVSDGPDLQFISKLWIDKASFEGLPKGVFAGLTELTSLSITKSALRRVQTGFFVGAQRLEDISIRNGRLESWPASKTRLPSLKSLNLTGNRLTEISRRWLQQFPQLKELRLTMNRIQQLEAGTFAESGQLTELSFARNPIKRIDDGVFVGLKRLSTLSLMYCEIAEPAPRAFAEPLPRIRYLELTGNRLKHLPLGVFSGVTAQKVSLRLEKNRLREIPIDFFDGFQGVLFLYLEDNPIDPRRARQIYRRVQKS